MPEHLKQGSEFPPVDPNRMRLYAMAYCPFAMRAALVLAHHQIDHEVVYVNLKEKPDWFVSRIPGGKVPAIEQNGEKMVDSEMICLFLDQLHPEDSLTTASGQEKIDLAKQWWSEAMKHFYPLAYDPSALDDNKGPFMESLKKFDAIPKDPFISGAKVGLADYLVYPMFDRLEASLRACELPVPTAEEMPSLHAWVKTMRALPAVTKVSISEERHYKFCKSQRAGNPDYGI